MTANASYEVQEKLEEFYTGGQVQVKQCRYIEVLRCTPAHLYICLCLCQHIYM